MNRLQMKKFIKARLKLTLFYSLILLIFSVILSTIYYWQTAGIINIHTQKINRKFEQDFNSNYSTRGPRIHGLVVQTELELARRQILKQIAIFNGLLLIFGVAASYFLSGKTLAPIKKTLLTQQQFVADAAHELRTPLTSLQTAVEASLLNKKLSKTAHEVLRDNLTEIKNLTDLTNKLLLLAQSENDITTSFSKVSLLVVIDKAIRQVKSLASHKQIKIDWQPQLTQEDWFVLGDEAALIKVIVILLDNAIKFSSISSTVKVSLKRNKTRVKVSVIDRGLGIAQEEQRHIFKRFYQVATARTKDDNGGYGLGLALAKKIVKQHRGSIVVESKLGEGSKFTVNLVSFGAKN